MQITKPKFPNIFVIMTDDDNRHKKIAGHVRTALIKSGVDAKMVLAFDKEVKDPSNNPLEICMKWVNCEWDVA